MPAFSQGRIPKRGFAHQPPDPAFTDPFTMLRPQDLAHAAITEDPAPFGMDNSYELPQATILQFPRGRPATATPRGVFSSRHAQAIAHVRHRRAILQGSEHPIPVDYREAK